VAGGASVFRRVAVRRVIATVSATAFLARPQVNPLRAHLDAFLAHTPLRLLDRGDGIDMRAGLSGHWDDVIILSWGGFDERSLDELFRVRVLNARLRNRDPAPVGGAPCFG
jgi:hypothetical protein